jgi:hypothetical protein
MTPNSHGLHFQSDSQALDPVFAAQQLKYRAAPAGVMELAGPIARQNGRPDLNAQFRSIPHPSARFAT